MSEDKIIEIVKDFISYIRFDEKPKYGVRQQYMAIENLLDLYQKEREKNKELTDFIEAIEELKQAKKPVTNLVYEMNKFKDDFISKDKIREILDTYRYTKIEDTGKIIEFYKAIQNLLEEN